MPPTVNSTQSPNPERGPEPTIDNAFRPAPANTPGDGYVDEVAGYMGEAGGYLASMPAAGPFTTRLKVPFTALGGAIKNLHAFKWSLNDAVATTIRNNKESLDGLQGEGLRTQLLKLRDNSLASKLGQAATVGQAALDALNAAADALDNAVFDALAPAGLTTNLTIEDHIADVSMKNDMLTRPRPITDALAMLENYASRPDADTQFERVCRVILELAREVRDTPAAKLKNRTGNVLSQTVGQDDQQNLALSAIKQVRMYREARMPAEIDLARQALRLLDQAFSILAGVHGRFVSYDDIKRNPKLLSYLDRSANEAARPWQLDPRWVQRFLPPDGAALPGWSEFNPMLRLSSGVKVRTTAFNENRAPRTW